MSRIYARSNELVDLCRYLNSFKIQKHQKNNMKIAWNEIALGANDLELYLPQEAIDYLTSKPICICRDRLSLHEKRSIPKDGETTMVSFPSFIAREEYQREFVFLLGLMLSLNNPDKDPGAISYDVQDEYRDVLPLFSEYLFLRENGQADDFALKRLNELRGRTSDYNRAITEYKTRIARAEDLIRNSALLSNKWAGDAEQYRDENIKTIEDLTHDTLIPFSSMNATLQLIDKNLSQDQIKTLIGDMFKNENGNRTDIMRDYGVTDDKYKRLIKEFERYKR